MASKLKVYISSTFLDMEEARDKIIDRINNGLSPSFELTQIMEKMSGDPSNRTNVDICRAEVRKADLYILLTGKRCGSSPDTYKNFDGTVIENTEGKSYTQLEYEAALETFEEKLYGIYKLELTDEFFTSENIPGHSDFDEPGREEQYKRFQQKLDQTVSSIKIKSGNELEKTINNKLTEFYQQYITTQSIELSFYEKASIDRTPQLSKIKGYNFGAGAYTLLIALEDENDCYDEFTARLYFELTNKDPNPNISAVRSSAVANFTSDGGEKLLNKLLAQCSFNIYNAVQKDASFERLSRALDTNKDITNVVISFVVDKKTDGPDSPLNYTQLISSFIKKISALLKEKDFGFNFYFLVYFFTDAEQPPPECISYFNELEVLPLEKLPKVKLEDAQKWVEEIKERKAVEEETEQLLKLIFIDKGIFPAKYKKCITLINKRIK